MKNYRFIICGDVVVNDDVDKDDLRDSLMDNVGMPFCGRQMVVDEVELERLDEDI